MKITAVPVAGCQVVESPPTSQRSQMAKSGSMAMAACSAAMKGPWCVGWGDPGAVEDLSRHHPPHRLRLEYRGRQVERDPCRVPLRYR